MASTRDGDREICYVVYYKIRGHEIMQKACAVPNGIFADFIMMQAAEKNKTWIYGRGRLCLGKLF